VVDVKQDWKEIFPPGRKSRDAKRAEL